MKKFPLLGEPLLQEKTSPSKQDPEYTNHIDDKLVWSIHCTFIAKKFRRQGVYVALLKGIAHYAKTVGIKIVEAYPNSYTRKTPRFFCFGWLLQIV